MGSHGVVYVTTARINVFYRPVINLKIQVLRRRSSFRHQLRPVKQRQAAWRKTLCWMIPVYSCVKPLNCSCVQMFLAINIGTDDWSPLTLRSPPSEQCWKDKRRDANKITCPCPQYVSTSTTQPVKTVVLCLLWWSEKILGLCEAIAVIKTFLYLLMTLLNFLPFPNCDFEGCFKWMKTRIHRSHPVNQYIWIPAN